MTENCGASTRVWPGDPTSSGTVGPPQPCNEVKLVDVPHMGYTANDKPHPRGEICTRGDNCFSVYYKGEFEVLQYIRFMLSYNMFDSIDEVSTRESVDEEGWVHSGDVGVIDDHGRIIIIDRMKVILSPFLSTFH